MPIFLVNQEEYTLDESLTLLQAKQELICKLGLSCKYIDLTIELEKPMRVLGKFNLEPGKLTRSLDRYSLDRFAFKRSLPVSVIEITDYDPSNKKPIIRRNTGRTYKGPHNLLENSVSTFDTSQTQQTMTVEPTFDLTSQEDFPSL